MLSKQQKSSLIRSVKIFVKSNPDKQNLFENFIDNETYYFNTGCSRLSFIQEFIEDSTFIKNLKTVFNEAIRYYNYQKELEPIKEAQKEFAKIQRKKAQDYKMSKETPTLKQIKYYKALCKKYNLKQEDLEDKSKLDLKNLIAEITNEYNTD